MTRRLLVDDFVDPLHWIGSIADTKSENVICIDAKLIEVQYLNGELSLDLSFQDQNLTAELRGIQLKTLTLSQAAEIPRSYRGDFLLCALAHRVSDGL